MNSSTSTAEPDAPPISEEATSTRAAAAAAPAKSSAGRFVRQFIVLLLLAGGLFWGVRYAQRLMTHAETDDAYITGHIHDISSRLAGTVTEVLFEENTEVKAGQILLRLDPSDQQSKLTQAEAMFSLAEAKAIQAESDIADNKAKVTQAEAQSEKAGLDFERARELSQTKVVSKQEYDAAKMGNDSAKAGAESAKASARGSESALIAARAQLKVAEAYRDDARLQLSYTTIVAPVSGRIGRRNVEIGHRVQAGQALLAIVQPEVWVEANYKETQLAKMRVGQEAEIEVDALPGHHFMGQIESFSPASGAQFAMLPPDNATGNFTKVVQRIPVRIHFDPKSIAGFEDRLQPGLSVVVGVRVK